MSRRRDLTWLQYLNNKGLVTLLSADFEGDRASFAPTDVDSPRHGGGGYVDLEADEEQFACSACSTVARTWNDRFRPSWTGSKP